MSRLRLFLTSTAAGLAFAAPLTAQEAMPPPGPQAAEPVEDDLYGDEEASDEAIVVVGQRDPRGVIGDIPPEDTLDARDIRATGATSIDELLEALEPQIG